MFVKVFVVPFGSPEEVVLPSIGRLALYDSNATRLHDQDGDRTYFSRHPPEMVRKALSLYAALLSGREEKQIPFPSLLSNVTQEPQRLSSLRLDLTTAHIEITEEIAPVDAEGNIQLDATQPRVRTLSYNKDAARKAAEPEAPKTQQIGQRIAGKGVYIGVWAPKDRTGRSLGKTFAVYAAPEDLTDASGKRLAATFKDAARELASKRNWHGFDGGDFASDTALYKGLTDGSAIGKWFLPTRDLLVGTDIDGKKVQDDTLYAHKDRGDLKGAFMPSRYIYRNYYWSLSERRGDQSFVWCARLADGDEFWKLKDYSRFLSSRPCRVEVLSL
jgi:hypothetical protein